MARSGATFAERAEGPARDARLHRALERASVPYLRKRARALEELEDLEELRTHAREVKEEALRHLPFLLEELERRLRQRGARVVWAARADRALEYVSELVRRKGVRLVVKGKSMTTEEIALNAALESQGVEVVETDLGEYIVQLAGERPSHIVTPAIHRTRADIARLFHERLAVPLGSRPEELTAAARHVLREKFRRAELGVTGVNFAVAENGALVVVENEGNARLCATAPRIHVAVVGIEKVLARVEDLEVLLRLLPRSATGQKLTSYVSWVLPPEAAGADGPEELHVILLDNGRSELLADAVLRESLLCIRCGACLNACPVYRKVGGHAYESPYPGPIGATISPRLVGPRTRELAFASTLCAACREVCPVRIDIPRLLLALRSEAVERTETAWWERIGMKFWRWTMVGRRRYELAGTLLRWASRFGNGSFRRLPGPLHGWTRYRDLPAPAPKPFRTLWKERVRTDGRPN
ncbi:MAG: iron-sulfur cluster-binding protein [Candidatus Binatia bacterium]|nr:MAG: iron-sulfur cluster-binding protein [Candidatus Binatia bacterium]